MWRTETAVIGSVERTLREPRKIDGGTLNSEIQAQQEAVRTLLKVKTSVKEFSGARDHRQHVTCAACNGADRTSRSIKSAAKLADGALDFLHGGSRNIVEAGHRFFRAERPLRGFVHVAP
jgi:hypothetical protein